MSPLITDSNAGLLAPACFIPLSFNFLYSSQALSPSLFTFIDNKSKAVPDSDGSGIAILFLYLALVKSLTSLGGCFTALVLYDKPNALPLKP